jgi:hypothetical protein
MQRLLLSILFLGAVVFPAVASWAQEDYKSMLPDGDGKELTIQLCGTCHNLQKTVVSRKSPQDWEKTVYDMVARGAQIFPDEADQIVKYLAKSFPPGKPAGQ